MTVALTTLTCLALPTECQTSQLECSSRCSKASAGLVFVSGMFDLVSMVTLLVVGILGIQGRMGLSTAAAWGCLSGGIGIFVLGMAMLSVKPVMKKCCFHTYQKHWPTVEA